MSDGRAYVLCVEGRLVMDVKRRDAFSGKWGTPPVLAGAAAPSCKHHNNTISRMCKTTDKYTFVKQSSLQISAHPHLLL
jgi:hypothetical protein